MPGVNKARRIPCARSKHHGHHPEDEPCPVCEPPSQPNTYDYDGMYGTWYGYRLCAFESVAVDRAYVREALLNIENGVARSDKVLLMRAAVMVLSADFEILVDEHPLFDEPVVSFTRHSKVRP